MYTNLSGQRSSIVTKKRQEREALTRNVGYLRSLRCLVPAGYLAHGFVASAQRDDCEQRQDEVEGVCDMPTAEDDAKIVGGPGEKHLSRTTIY